MVPLTVAVSEMVPLAPSTTEPVMAAVVLIVGPGWIVTHSRATGSPLMLSEMPRSSCRRRMWRRSSRCPRRSA